MSRTCRCAHCRRHFLPDPRVKTQRFCSNKVCQRARKAQWQRAKLATDPDYRANQRDCQHQWQQRHPQYWRQYRQQRADYRERNRLLQQHRDVHRHFKRYFAILLGGCGVDRKSKSHFALGGAGTPVPPARRGGRQEALGEDCEGCLGPGVHTRGGVQPPPRRGRRLRGPTLQRGLSRMRSSLGGNGPA